MCFLWLNTLQALDPNKPFFQYVSSHWEVEDGLPQSTVSDLVQDHRGFIWLATPNGLARFDGSEFVIFDTANSPELSTNLITALYFDRQQRLWIGTYLGIVIIEQDEMRKINIPDQPIGEVTDFIEMPSGDVLIATSKQLLVYRNQQLEIFDDTRYPSHSLILDENRIIVGGLGKIAVIEGVETQFLTLPDASEDAKVTDMVHYAGWIWLATEGGLIRLDTENFRMEKVKITGEPIFSLSAEEGQALWIAAKSGLYRLNQGFVLSKANNALVVEKLMQDREQSLWLGTANNGLWQLTQGKVNRFSSESGLTDMIVWSVVAMDAETHWLGTGSTLFRFQNDQFTSLLSTDRLSSTPIYTLAKVDRESALVGTRLGLFLVRDEVFPFVESVPELSAVQINAIKRVAENTFWILTSEGVNELSLPSLEIKFLDYTDSDVRAIIRYRNLVILGTKQGLKVFGDNAESLNIPSSLKEAFVTSLYKSNKESIFWVTTYSQGIYRFDGKNWYHFNQSKGLFSNSHFNAVEYDSFLWLSGFNGLYRIPLMDLEEYVKKNRGSLRKEAIVSESNDLINAQKGQCCNGVGGAKWELDKRGLWFVSNNGIINVDTQDIIKNTTPPKIIIHSITTARAELNLLSKQLPSLKFQDRDLRFDFSVTSFQNARANRIEVKLEGYDRDWIDVSETRSRFYPNLSPGSYSLQARGFNNSGVVSEKNAEVSFEVKGKFVESLWFSFILFVISVVLFYFIYGLLRQKSLESMMRLEKQLSAVEIEKEKLRNELADLTNYNENYGYLDRLTGSYTFKYLEQQLQLDIHYYERVIDKPISVRASLVFVLIDIDKFQQVNHQYSEQIGDLILQQFSNLIRRAIRDSDYLVRWRDDKFIVIFRPVVEENISTVTERIRQLVEQCRFIIDEDEHLKITSSISYTDFPIIPGSNGSISWQTLLQLAEKGLKEVKKAGGNKWIGYQLKENALQKFNESSQPIKVEDFTENEVTLQRSWDVNSLSIRSE
ncbi:MAG: diguanylate cyclase [Pseudomonadota bacterium]